MRLVKRFKSINSFLKDKVARRPSVNIRIKQSVYVLYMLSMISVIHTLI